MENIKINPEVEKLAKPSKAELLATEATEILVQAKTYTIKTAEQFQAVGEELKRIKGVRKQVDDLFDTIIKKAHEAHKAAVASKKQLTDPLDMAEGAFKKAMLVYNAEQQRLAAVEQEKLRAIAEEQARKEREKLEAQALKAMESGKEEKAEELLSCAETVQAFVPIVTPQVSTVSGVSTRKTWKAKVVNPSLVPAYSGDIELRKIDQGQLDRIAKMTSGSAKIPGVEFYEESSLAVRGL